MMKHLHDKILAINNVSDIVPTKITNSEGCYLVLTDDDTFKATRSLLPAHSSKKFLLKYYLITTSPLPEWLSGAIAQTRLQWQPVVLVPKRTVVLNSHQWHLLHPWYLHNTTTHLNAEVMRSKPLAEIQTKNPSKNPPATDTQPPNCHAGISDITSPNVTITNLKQTPLLISSLASVPRTIWLWSRTEKWLMNLFKHFGMHEPLHPLTQAP